MKNVTAIIKTFLRDEYLYTCVDSLLEVYPDIKILIADDSYENPKKDMPLEKRNFYKKVEKLGHQVHFLPYDSGLCVGRNALVQKVKTKYLLIGDDDFKYSIQANIDKMVNFLDNNRGFDLIGGRIIEGEVIKNYQGLINDRDPHRFVYTPLELNGYNSYKGFKYKPCDITFNFFIARTKAVKKVPWDEQIKVAYEHSSFFIDFKRAGYKVAFTPDCIVEHKPAIQIKNRQSYSNYLYYRTRKSDRKRFYERFGIHTVVDMQGRVDIFDSSEMQDIDIIFKTMKRRESVEKLLFSIAKRYPMANIMFADDDEGFDYNYYVDLWQRLNKRGLKKNPVCYNMPYDTGLAECRNFLIEKCRRPYVLLIDDDFIFTENTDISKFIQVLEHNEDIGVVGGLLFDGQNEMHYEHKWWRRGKRLYHKSDGNKWIKVDKGLKYKLTECILNFALFRREVFNDIQFDNQFKISGEHTDFYLRFKELDWKIAYTRDVNAIHKSTGDVKYRALRQREEFLKLLFIKHDLEQIIYLDGFRYIFDGKRIIHTRATK